MHAESELPSVWTVRDAPSFDANVTRELEHGATITVVEQRGRWLRLTSNEWTGQLQSSQQGPAGATGPAGFSKLFHAAEYAGDRYCPVLCPTGHVLQHQQTTSQFCDVCACVVPSHTLCDGHPLQHLGCRACNYDICWRCYVGILDPLHHMYLATVPPGFGPGNVFYVGPEQIPVTVTHDKCAAGQPFWVAERLPELPELPKPVSAPSRKKRSRSSRSSSDGTSGQPASKQRKKKDCRVKTHAREYLATLGIDDLHLDHRFDRCYCERCYPMAWPDTISNEGPTPYVVPRGWVRFGLAVPQRATVLNIFEEWSVSFHGTKSPQVLESILDCGQLMKAGDRLLDGTKLRSTKCAGRQDKVFYTSPTIKYAGLKFYAEPQPFGSRGRSASIALQCRQKPGSFKTQGETMGFESEWPEHLEDECPHVDLETLEWTSATNVAAIPYGLLIRTFRTDDDESYRSPLDD